MENYSNYTQWVQWLQITPNPEIKYIRRGWILQALNENLSQDIVNKLEQYLEWHHEKFDN